jgi:hypothetical protein
MRDEWKAILAYIYAFICFFDFVVVPSWIGINRPPIDDLAYLNIEKFKQVWQHHQPFTLQGGRHVSSGIWRTFDRFGIKWLW